MQSQLQQAFETLTKAQFNSLFTQREYVNRGQQGSVYKAKTSKGQIVAVKEFIRKIVAESFKYVSAEINSLKIMNHPTILKFYGCYKVEDTYYLATQFCDGGTLSDLKRTRSLKRLSEITKMSICLQLAQGIQHAHQHNVMHRDLKPDNIMFVGNYQVKICDFGCSKTIEEGLDGSVLQTAIVGTPLYSAPDMKEGDYSNKCDMYSLGLIFYEIFTEKEIFQNASSLTDLNNLRESLAKNLQKRIQSMKPSNHIIREVIIGCLRAKDVDRFDATTVVNLLTGYFKPINSSISTIQQSYIDELTPEIKFFGKLISCTENISFVQKRISAKKLVFSKILGNKDVIDKDVKRLQGLESVKKETKQMFFVLVVAYYQYWLRNFSKFLNSESSIYTERYKQLAPTYFDGQFKDMIQTHIEAELKRTGKAMSPFAKKIYRVLNLSKQQWRPIRYEEIVICATGSMQDSSKIKEEDLKNAIKDTFEKKICIEFYKAHSHDNEDIIVLRRIIDQFK